MRDRNKHPSFTSQHPGDDTVKIGILQGEAAAVLFLNRQPTRESPAVVLNIIRSPDYKRGWRAIFGEED